MYETGPIDGHWERRLGYINTRGEIIVPLEFRHSRNYRGLASDIVYPFSNGRVSVACGNLNTIIVFDTEGRQVAPFGPYTTARNFSESIIIVTSDDGVGGIDVDGNIVIPFGRYSRIGETSEGLAEVNARTWDNPLWGFIDRNGNEIIAPQFDRVGRFSEGLAVVNTGVEVTDSVIDIDGNEVIPTGRFNNIRGFSNGLAAVNVRDQWNNWNWGFIDRHGNIVVEPQYVQAHPFAEGLTWVNAGTFDNPLWGILQIDNFVPATPTPSEYDQEPDGYEYEPDERSHTPDERPERFEPPPESVDRVIDPETAEREIEDTIRNLTPEQRESGDALSTVTQHIEQAERRGTTQQLPQGGSLDAAALRSGAVVAQDIRRSTENVLRGEDVRLHRHLRTNLNFETGERRSVAVEFPEDVADVSFDSLTVEAPFAAATINREHIAEGNSLQFGLVERTGADTGETTLGQHLSNILKQDRTYGEFLLTFWVFVATALMLITYIVLALAKKRLRAWVVPVFICLAVGINILTLWISYDPDDGVVFQDGVIEVSMSEGMRATLSLPTGGIRGNPESLVLFNEDNEPQFTKHNPSTGAVDARIHHGGTFTLREHTVSFADIEDKSALMRQAIETIASRGIMSGLTENEFAPDDLITRSEFISTVVMAFDMLDLDARATFIDLEPAAWYYHAVATAEGAGIVHAYEDGTFRGDQNIRKDELTVVSANALVERMGYITPTDIEPILARYLDRPEIESWAEGGVALATQSNVLIFRADGLFGPAGAMTRGDAAIVLYRLFNRVW